MAPESPPKYRLHRFWRKLSHLGVTSLASGIPDRKLRTIALTNQINFVLGAIFLMVVITDPLLLGKFDASTTRYSIGLAGCILSLLLNTRQHHTASRLLLIALMPSLFLGYPALQQNTNEVALLWMPTGVVIYSMLPYMIFQWPEEKRVFLLAQGLLFCFCMASDLLLVSGANPEFPILGVLEKHYVPYKRSIVALWVFLNLPMIYFMRLARRYEDRLQASNREIQLNQEQMVSQNEELIAHQEQIRTINQSLEKLVAERTEALQLQNDRLAEYAFINAHLLRAPLARIQGLVYLMELTHALPKNDLLFKHLQEAVDEFNLVVQQINRLVDEGDHFSRQDFAPSTSLAPKDEE